MRIVEQLDEPRSRAALLGNLGAALTATGDYREAKNRLEEALGVVRQIGDWELTGGVLDNLGRASLKLGSFDDSRRYFLEFLQASWRVPAVPYVLQGLYGFAQLLIRKGRTSHAQELLTFVLTHPKTLVEIKFEAEELRERLKQELTPSELAEVEKRAKSKELKEYVQEMLDLFSSGE